MSDHNDTTSAPEGPANTPAPADTTPAPAAPSAPASPPPTPSVNDTPPPAPAAAPEPEVDPAEHDRAGILAAIKAKTDAETTPTAHEPGQEPAKPAKPDGEAKEPPKPEPDPSAPKPEGEDGEDDGEGDDAEDDADPEANALTPEERAAVSGKVKRKVGRLLRNVRRLEPDAKAYRNITTFMATNQLTGAEAAQGFEVMAMLKRDDPRALEVLRPFIERIQRVQGAILPDDLQQKVQGGYLDAESAAEMARLRHANDRAALERDNQRQSIEQFQATQQAQTVAAALNAWETPQLANPAYVAVRKAVFDYAQASFKANPPVTPAEAVKRIESFYSDLAMRAPVQPAGVSRPVQAIRPGPSSTHSPSNLPAREPQSLEDAITMSLRKRGAA